MNKFTKGEWQAVEHYSKHDTAKGIIKHPSHHVECGDDVICDYIENLDDARLISAAPDMYRALRDVAGELGYEADSGLGDGYYTVNLTQSEVDAIRAALAKADGGG